MLLETFAKRATIDANLHSQNRMSAIRALQAIWLVSVHFVAHFIIAS